MAPESIAVVGASPRQSRGTVILRNLRRLGYEGSIYAVHPSATDIEGTASFPTLADLPEPVEMVAIAVGAESAIQVLGEAADMGAGAALVVAGGFEGTDSVALDRSERLRATAQSSGMLVCGPNCYGIFDAHSGFAAYSGPIVEPLDRGNVAYVLHSGALTHALHDSALGRDVGISTVVTTGNELVVSMGDYVDWLVGDPETNVIGLFIEQIRDVESFSRAATRAAEAGKRIVALRAGRSQRGREATVAHTGAVSGSQKAYDAFFRQHDIAVVRDLDEMREALILFSHVGRGPHRGPVMLTISGGLSGLMSDLAEELGLTLPRVSDLTVAELGAVLPAYATVANPLDLTGGAAERPELLSRAGEILGGCDEIGALVLVFNTPQRAQGQEELSRVQARLFAQLSSTQPLPCVAITAVSGPIDDEIQQTLAQAGIPLLVGLREALIALRSWSSTGKVTPVSAMREPTRTLELLVTGSEALTVAADNGLTTPVAAVCESLEECVAAAGEIGYPVALKIDDLDVAHKTELGGVVVGLDSADAVAASAASLLREGAASRLLVQQMVDTTGLECLVGVVRDPDLGLQIVLGPGGRLVELMGHQAATRLVPVTRSVVDEMIDETALAPLLAGYRGSGPLDREALVDAVCAVSRLAENLHSSLFAIDVNPLIVLQEGAVAVDVTLEPLDPDGAAGRPPPFGEGVVAATSR